ncbi:MSCRAMM family protein [Microbacterium sp. ASV81]|uniref:alpha-amylase n=1 Tax=Microbacterium capsulatum TaxID=3041921 RepID=A0ABU0XBH4_9MICO|nr:carboxypeptidase regulatory-like domain-containing protein [Microbacterium sp. ASV81]MDQ4212462.1 carboxypeptidase regulatory-like domain-containing protein [Microbacterium sp. ASV81]
MRRAASAVVTVLLALSALAFAAAPAAAATGTPWADWTPMSGSPGAYTGGLQIASPQLRATYTSDSRGGSVGVISGASTWLSAATPVGQKYGSSRDQQYLNLRPRADTPTAPSETTYTFAHATTASGWTFVLGDIDADKVQIAALGPDGHRLTAAELGFRGGFNYCATGAPGAPSCTGDPADVPSWDPATATLTGNLGAVDTSGAAAWFEPNTPVSSLTFAFTRRAGFPVYQTWFAAITRTVSGTVTDTGASAPSAGTTVRLVAPDGTVIGQTATAPDGTYSFADVVAADGYTVEIAPPPGRISDAPRGTVDVTNQDGTVDFSVRDIVPVPVSGTVKDTHGTPIAGATVVLDGGRTVVTDATGAYLLDDVPVGPHVLTITPQAGYTLISSPAPFTVPLGSTTPITGQDFVLRAPPTISGTVAVAGTGIGGVLVTANGPGGTVQAVTAADGTYAFPKSPSGDYTVTVAAPQGYDVVGSGSRTETVGAGDVTGVDFALSRLGSVAGTVTEGGGAPHAGATVSVAAQGGPLTATTAADGTYELGDLAPGDYTIDVTVPPGFTGSTPTSRAFTITAAGELIDGQDFVLAPAQVAPDPDPAPTTTSPAAGGGRVSALAPTGADPLPAVGVGLALLLAGAAALVLVRRRRA